MDESKKIRMLLLLVFLLSAVCSMCLGLATYTHITGELPFDLETHYKFRSESYGAREKKMNAAIVPIQEGTIDEITLRKLHNEMKEKEILLNNKEERLLETEELVKSLLASTETARKKTADTLTAINKAREDKKAEFKKMTADLNSDEAALANSLKTVDGDIVKQIAATLEDMKPLTSMIILNDLDLVEASRLLNSMKKEKRAAILSEMIEVTEVNGVRLSVKDKINFRKKANEIIKELRKMNVDKTIEETK
jgi:hypothetical protein